MFAATSQTLGFHPDPWEDLKDGTPSSVDFTPVGKKY